MGDDRQHGIAPAMQRYVRSAFLRNVTSTFGMNILLLAVSIANSAIIARALGPGGKGILTLALLTPNLLGLLLGLGIGGANVYHTGTRRIPVPPLVRNSMGVALLASLVGAGAIGLLLVTGWLTRLLPGVPVNIALLALLIFPLGLLSSYLNGILQGQQHIFKLNTIMALQSVATLALTLLLVMGLHLELAGGVLAYVGAAALAVALTVSAVRREGAQFAPAWQPSVLRPSLAYGLKGYVGNILQFFNYRLDVFLVNFFLGSTGVGIYSVSVALAELLWQFPNAVSFVIFPKSSATKTAWMNAFTPRVFYLTLALTALGGFGLALLGHFMILLIFGERFSAAYQPMLALLPGVILLGGGKVLTNEIAGRGYPHYNSISSGLGLVLTLALDLLLIPRYGVLGAAIASSLAYTVVFGAAVFFYRMVSRSKSDEPMNP